MSMSSSSAASTQEDRFGRAVAARLSQGQATLHPDIAERLRVARRQAVARRKAESAPLIVQSRHGQAALAGGGTFSSSRWWSRGASVLPLVALVAGLVTIAQWQADARADAIAEIDAALLTDELPTSAYTDPGFRQFLQHDGAAVR